VFQEENNVMIFLSSVKIILANSILFVITNLGIKTLNEVNLFQFILCVSHFK